MRSDDVLSGEGFHLRYDMIMLEESVSLLAHFDEQTMSGKEIGIWNLFDELPGKMLLMDGDISDRSLSFASVWRYVTKRARSGLRGLTSRCRKGCLPGAVAAPHDQ